MEDLSPYISIITIKCKWSKSEIKRDWHSALKQ